MFILSFYAGLLDVFCRQQSMHLLTLHCTVVPQSETTLCNFTSASSHHCLCNFYIFTTVMDTIWSDNWMYSFSFKRKCTYAEHLCIITLYANGNLAQAWCLCITFWCHDRHLVWAHAHRPFPWCSAGRGPLPHAAFIYMIRLCKHHLWLPRGLKQDQTSIS